MERIKNQQFEFNNNNNVCIPNPSLALSKVWFFLVVFWNFLGAYSELPFGMLLLPFTRPVQCKDVSGTAHPANLPKVVVVCTTCKFSDVYGSFGSQSKPLKVP